MTPEKMKLTDFLSLSIERNRPQEDRLEPKGHFVIEHFDKDSKKLAEYKIKNQITNDGKNHWLGVEFQSVTQITAWYMGLIDSSGWTAEAVTDTLPSHGGWNEFAGYSGSRPAWTVGAASGQAISNPSPTSFTITSAATLQGIFVCSAASGTSGTLWNTSDFGSTVPVNIGDVLKVTYTVNS